jgi:hypothetical protein
MVENGFLLFKFSINCDSTKYGESIHVAGNQINNWASDNSIELKTCKTVYPFWESGIHHIKIDYDKPFNYKYLIKRGEKVVRWEEIKEHRMISIINGIEDKSKNLIQVSTGTFGVLSPQIVTIKESINLYPNLENRNEIVVTEEDAAQIEESELNKSLKDMEFTLENNEKNTNYNEMAVNHSNTVTAENYLKTDISLRKEPFETEPNSPFIEYDIPLCKSKLSLNNGCSGKNIASLDYETNVTENQQISRNREDLILFNDEEPKQEGDLESLDSSTPIETMETKRENHEVMINCDYLQAQKEENVDIPPESAQKSNNDEQKINNDMIPENQPENEISPAKIKKGNLKIDLSKVNRPDDKYKVNQTQETPNPPQEGNACCCIIV